MTGYEDIDWFMQVLVNVYMRFDEFLRGGASPQDPPLGEGPAAPIPNLWPLSRKTPLRRSVTNVSYRVLIVQNRC